MIEKETPKKTLIIEDRAYETYFTMKFERRKTYSIPDPKKLHCVIPGVIQNLYVHAGKKVQRDERLLVLEAMKMQNYILSPFEGKIKKVYVSVGEMVPKGSLLLEFE
jgi:biotin carboxyl carrier protein